VQAFLERRIRFPQIASIIEDVLNLEPAVEVESLDSVLLADASARAHAEQWLQRNGR
jgi:1-deoxy-D-xylulose-5-phosphate reductoisomerase